MSSKARGHNSGRSGLKSTKPHFIVCGATAALSYKIIMLGSLDRMDAAFCLGPAAPAAGAGILIRRGPAGAGHTPDRQETRCDKWMRRQLCKRVDRLDVLAGNVGERIEFQPDAVFLDHRQVGTEAALKTLASVDPGRERRQRAGQRLDFANPAAGVGIGEP